MGLHQSATDVVQSACHTLAVLSDVKGQAVKCNQIFSQIFCYFAVLEVISIVSHSIPYRYVLFYSILFYSILFYSILFYSILFYSILFYSILFYSILFNCIVLYYTVFL